MKIVVTIATIDPAHGGPARSVPALCRELSNLDVDLELVTIAEHSKTFDGLRLSGFKSTVIQTTATRYQPRSWSKRLKAAIDKAVRAKDTILYDVGVWLPSNHFAARIATETITPFVISPRGMLSEEALRHSMLKKKLAWHSYQRRDLKRAQVLHATSEKEAHEFRALGLAQPIAVVPNGVEIPMESRQLTTDRKPQTRIILFLSRLHPMKGLKDLVQAWAKVHPNDWRVVIAGPNENNHREEIESVADSLGVRGDFEFVGSVDDRQKWKLLSEADLFVLPSYSESFGMAIAEALAAGVPVITTCATPWRDLETHRCGWWVDTGADSIAKALSSATACSSDELQAMGARGRELVSKNYSWESSAKNLLSVFEWVLGKAAKPSCVV